MCVNTDVSICIKVVRERAVCSLVLRTTLHVDMQLSLLLFCGSAVSFLFLLSLSPAKKDNTVIIRLDAYVLAVSPCDIVWSLHTCGRWHLAHAAAHLLVAYAPGMSHCPPTHTHTCTPTTLDTLDAALQRVQVAVQKWLTPSRLPFVNSSFLVQRQQLPPLVCLQGVALALGWWPIAPSTMFAPDTTARACRALMVSKTECGLQFSAQTDEKNPEKWITQPQSVRTFEDVRRYVACIA